jgi:alpha-D-ribose 1-methylphosphonate 5-phosphate C-P lyase
MSAPAYNFAYLDEQTKRMVRRAILKAIAIPGYQVPFASREMPMPYGWGTGGVQVTASIIGPDDTLKVIDQGADDTTNAVSIRKFFERTAGVATTTRTADATIIQTRHRIPEMPLRAGQILVYQVPIPEPLRFLEPRESETRQMHALQDYGLMHVKLYEDIARHGHIATTYAYPVKIAGRYVMDPSPIPKFDNPKMDNCPALQLFGAGREQPLSRRTEPRGQSGHEGERLVRAHRCSGLLPRRSVHQPDRRHRASVASCSTSLKSRCDLRNDRATGACRTPCQDDT